MRQHEKPSCSPYGKSIVHGTGEKASGALIASPVHVIKNGIFHSSILGEMHMAFRTLWHYLFVGRRGPKLGFYDVSRLYGGGWADNLLPKITQTRAEILHRVSHLGDGRKGRVR